jgi:hypothetical protein
MARLALGRPIPRGLLHELTDEECRRVYEIGHRRSFRRNSIIYSQGDPSGVTYLVEGGDGPDLPHLVGREGVHRRVLVDA